MADAPKEACSAATDLTPRARRSSRGFSTLGLHPISPKNEILDDAICSDSVSDSEEEEEVIKLLIPDDNTSCATSLSDTETMASGDECRSETESSNSICSESGGESEDDACSVAESYASDDGVEDFEQALRKRVNRDVRIFPPTFPPTYLELREHGPTRFDPKPEGMSDEEWCNVLTKTHDTWFDSRYQAYREYNQRVAMLKPPLPDRDDGSEHARSFWGDVDTQC
ncbi:hypothetical protein MPER_11988 [Moniliophthora perniciosa FA553]|nr:hypothetical protein MPER_11988 [Moniliophthora perniciosa FA553]